MTKDKYFENHITISISKENYAILKQLGQTSDSFNKVLTSVLTKILSQEGSEKG